MGRPTCDSAARKFALIRSRRHGFTLIELMVTIVIIAILASMFMVALTRAQKAANISATQGMITQFHGALSLRYEAYRTRRLPDSNAGIGIGNLLMPVGANQPRWMAGARLSAIRELMRLELPDRFSDITDPPQILPPSPNLPALTTAYQAKLAAAPSATLQYEDAECLYMIITAMPPDDSPVNHLRSDNVGDRDGDGLPEFVDSWGMPIRWCRWAPGFVSDLQIADPAMRHDAFDPMKVHQGAFDLKPLIYSAGPDREYDIVRSNTDGGGFTQPFHYSTTSFTDPIAGFTFPYNPFQQVTVGTNPGATQTQLIGAVSDLDTATGETPDGEISNDDNIHNHLIGLP